MKTLSHLTQWKTVFALGGSQFKRVETLLTEEKEQPLFESKKNLNLELIFMIVMKVRTGKMK